MNTLEAVNQMLSAVGEAPVTTIDTDNPELGIALATLNQVNKEVQAERWHFNREYNYSLTPNVDGEFVLPDNVLFIQVNKDRFPVLFDLTVRAGKLYDRRSHSFKFTTEQILVDVVWAFPFDDIPLPFKLYITQRAARVFVSRSQGSQEMVRLANIDEERLRANCVAYDADEQKLTMAVDRNRNQYNNTFSPFDAVWRF
jgi:hypothetical protein